MTWTCPYCDRDYPDSAIGVPVDNDAADMRGCKVCWVSPEGTGRYIRPDAADAESEEINVWLGEYDMDHLIDGQPVYKRGSGETLLILRKRNVEAAD